MWSGGKGGRVGTGNQRLGVGAGLARRRRRRAVCGAAGGCQEPMFEMSEKGYLERESNQRHVSLRTLIGHRWSERDLNRHRSIIEQVSNRRVASKTRLDAKSSSMGAFCPPPRRLTDRQTSRARRAVRNEACRPGALLITVQRSSRLRAPGGW